MAGKQIQVKAIVLKEVSYKEADKILSVLTDTLGQITLRCRGVRSLKSRRFASAQTFVYSDMVISEKNGQYTMEEAEPIESFFAIRERFEAIALAQYFAEVVASVTVEGESDPAVLSLLLNSLYLVSEKPEMPLQKIKAVFELRLCRYLGFAPTVFPCSECGGKEALFWFNIAGGGAVCESCVKNETPDVLERVLVPTDEGTRMLIRYITESEDKRIFSFTCEDSLTASLARFSEKYLLYHLGRGFDTLTFYHSVTD